MDAIVKSKPKFGDNEIRCKLEEPIKVRVVRSLLLGLRWQLGEWGLNKKAIKVDVPSPTLNVDDKPVVTATIADGRLQMARADPTWEAWEDLDNSEEMKELLNEGSKKLKQAAENRAAGLGKGKGAGKSA